MGGSTVVYQVHKRINLSKPHPLHPGFQIETACVALKVCSGCRLFKQFLQIFFEPFVQGLCRLDIPGMYSYLNSEGISSGCFATFTPAASNAFTLPAAVPDPPSMIAPACPIRLPGGAV